MTDRRFNDVLEKGLTDEHDHEYDPGKFRLYRDLSFGLDDIRNGMRRLYLVAKSRRNEASGRIAGRGIVASAESCSSRLL